MPHTPGFVTLRRGKRAIFIPTVNDLTRVSELLHACFVQSKLFTSSPAAGGLHAVSGTLTALIDGGCRTGRTGRTGRTSRTGIAANCCDSVRVASGSFTQRIARRSGASTGCSGLCPLPLITVIYRYFPFNIARHIRLRCTTPRQAGVRTTTVYRMQHYSAQKKAPVCFCR